MNMKNDHSFIKIFFNILAYRIYYNIVKLSYINMSSFAYSSIAKFDFIII